MSNIIELDVSGYTLKTTLSTLNKSEYFNTLLSRWNNSDKIFIDCDIDGFKEVLEYLRFNKQVHPKYHYLLDYYCIDYNAETEPQIPLYMANRQLNGTMLNLAIHGSSIRKTIDHPNDLYYQMKQKPEKTFVCYDIIEIPSKNNKLFDVYKTTMGDVITRELLYVQDVNPYDIIIKKTKWMCNTIYGKLLEFMDILWRPKLHKLIKDSSEKVEVCFDITDFKPAKIMPDYYQIETNKNSKLCVDFGVFAYEQRETILKKSYSTMITYNKYEFNNNKFSLKESHMLTGIYFYTLSSFDRIIIEGHGHNIVNISKFIIEQRMKMLNMNTKGNVYYVKLFINASNYPSLELEIVSKSCGEFILFTEIERNIVVKYNQY